jgi:hydrogenase maturation protease
MTRVGRPECWNSGDVVVIGTGNPYRCDDGVGLVVVPRLRKWALPGVCVLSREEASDVMTAWAGFDLAIVVDAVYGSRHPGRIHRLDPALGPFPTDFFRYSTHTFGLAEAIELSRAIGELPKRLVVYGIEGKEFGAGETLSPEVVASVEPVIARILTEIRDWRSQQCESWNSRAGTAREDDIERGNHEAEP